MELFVSGRRFPQACGKIKKPSIFHGVREASRVMSSDTI
jgi:hypothetical protein